MEQEITLPKLGESIVEATIVQWFKKEGDHVSVDEPLLEVSTDKINSEIPSPIAGQIKSIKAEVDERVEVGQLLATIETEAAKEAKPKEKVSSFSPAVLRLAQEHHLSIQELDTISGSGADGRVTKKDVESYLKKKESNQEVSDGSSETVKMTPLRKAIADTMVRSFYEAPHASLISEIDVTNVMQYIKANKEKFLSEHHVKLSITTFFAKALCHVIKKFPLLNASVKEDQITMKHFINLGIAVSVDHGVVVPVIKDCDKMTLSQIAKAISSLANKARKEELSHEEVEGGTITLTNFGMTGTLIGIPIIRHPEVAIIGMGAVHRKVVAIDDNTTAIRKCMHVSLTFDHRVLDGMYGCSFLQELKSYLENYSFDE